MPVLTLPAWTLSGRDEGYTSRLGKGVGDLDGALDERAGGSSGGHRAGGSSGRQRAGGSSGRGGRAGGSSGRARSGAEVG
jgi:hypothetical protein